MDNDAPEDDEALRSECTNVLKRCFPDAKSADCTKKDVSILLAVFLRNRYAVRSDAPALPESTRYLALDKLVTGAPFYFVNRNTGLVDLRRYFKLLSDAFISIRKEGSAIEHDCRNNWYMGVNKLDSIVDNHRRRCPLDKRIEVWDVVFLLKHIQYLLIGTEDTNTLMDNAGEKAGLVIKGVLQGYGGQWDSAGQTALALAHRKRTRAKWHHTFLELEQKSFETYASRATTDDTVSADELDKKELDFVVELRNTLENEFLETATQFHGTRKAVKSIFGKIGRSLMGGGPYEEHAEYFKYGLLDLLYQSTFRIRNSEACFDEIIGAVQLVLDKAHPSANLLHYKAIDLYHCIRALGDYGKKEEVEAIEAWKKENGKNKMDTKENSKQYRTRRKR